MKQYPQIIMFLKMIWILVKKKKKWHFNAISYIDLFKIMLTILYGTFLFRDACSRKYRGNSVIKGTG